MTAQASDRLVHDGLEYSVAVVENEWPEASWSDLLAQLNERALFDAHALRTLERVALGRSSGEVHALERRERAAKRKRSPATGTSSLGRLARCAIRKARSRSQPPTRPVTHQSPA